MHSDFSLAQMSAENMVGRSQRHRVTNLPAKVSRPVKVSTPFFVQRAESLGAIAGTVLRLVSL